MKIALGNGLFAEIDDADYDLISRFRWHVTKGPKVARTFYTQAYVGGGHKNQISTSMHRLIMSTRDGEMVDHIDGDGLNNRRSNLRICNQIQNCANSRPHLDSKMNFKGVRFKNDANRKKPYAARVRFNGSFYHLEHFTTEKEAAEAYDAKRLELSMEFAGTNAKVASGGFA